MPGAFKLKCVNEKFKKMYVDSKETEVIKYLSTHILLFTNLWLCSKNFLTGGKLEKFVGINKSLILKVTGV